MYALRENLIKASENGSKEEVALIVNKLRSEFLELKKELLEKEFLIDFFYENKSIIKVKTTGAHTLNQIISKYETVIKKAAGIDKTTGLIYCSSQDVSHKNHIYMFNTDIIRIKCHREEDPDEVAKMSILTIRTLTGAIDNVRFLPSDTVFALKLRYQKIKGTDPSQQRLIYLGKQLEDMRILSDYNIQRHSALNCVLRLRGGMFHITSGLVDYNAVKGYISDISKLDVLIRDMKSRIHNEIGSLNYFLSQLNSL
jgi:hypothetical protein